MSMVEFRNVSKSFGHVPVLKDINLRIDAGEVVVVVGPSGSGKSTMLRCINALEKITGGDLLVDGQSVKGKAAVIHNIRLEAGMVFQQFNLFPQMTALENVMFGPIQVRGASRAQARDQATALLAKVGLGARANHYPSELSGGQQQRVAIARALVTKPACVLADEPTGNLDGSTADHVFHLMLELSRTLDTSFVIVTHDPDLAARCDRILRLRDGVLHEEPAVPV